MVDVSGELHRKRWLGRDMAQAMAAMRGQLMVRCIGRHSTVEIHCNDSGVRAGNGKIAGTELACAMKQ